MKKLFLSFTFLKSQIASVGATAIDFIVLFVLVEFFQVWYVLAAGIAAFCGALSGFLLGRQWAFVSKDDKWHSQAMRYAAVALGSMVLNTLGVYLLTEGLSLYYMFSKLFTSIAVSVGYNYPLLHYYVFKKKA